MTPSELVQHPEVEGAIDRLADRIRSNGGISIPREAIADLLVTLLTVLRESEGPVWLDLLDATRDAQVDPDIAVVSWADLARVRDAFQDQAATRVGALEARIKELEDRIETACALWNGTNGDAVHAVLRVEAPR